MDFKATGSGFFRDPGAKKAGYPANFSRREEVTFGTVGELRRHLDETHDEAKRCDVCGTKWDTVMGLCSHRGNKHKGHHGVGSGKPPEGREQ